ncbi:MAG: FKBP-type peptidyl-prolyl cis-trans isomerase [Prevotellaceae bacterium]|jgi:hypothetical protein|nr:FKBP-type peptidyl-prolyl cis-trans isomerase [Prevotellaceae bacterium]
MKHKNLLFGLGAALLFAASLCCDKDDPIEKQEASIDSYIRTKMDRNPSLKLLRDGSVSYLYLPGDSAAPAVSPGDSLYIIYTGVLLADTSRCFVTNDIEVAAALGMDTVSGNFAPLGVAVGEGKLIKGLDSGLKMAHPKDKGEIIFNSDYGFGNKAVGIVPAYSALIYKLVISG